MFSSVCYDHYLYGTLLRQFKSEVYGDDRLKKRLPDDADEARSLLADIFEDAYAVIQQLQRELDEDALALCTFYKGRRNTSFDDDLALAAYWVIQCPEAHARVEGFGDDSDGDDSAPYGSGDEAEPESDAEPDA